MNKVWKAEKKKAQYENRIRALEARVIECQELIKEQDDYIRYLNGKILEQSQQDGNVLVVDSGTG